MRYWIFLFLTNILIEINAQDLIPLYIGNTPNSKKTENKEQDFPDETVDTITRYVSEPSLTAFFPSAEKRNGTAVIICPGGGYHLLLTKREGSDVARAFNALGISAFVLRYRPPNDLIMVDKSIGPLQDAQMAIKIVRERAEEWGIDIDKIGIMGFSAGGHLASTATVRYSEPFIVNEKETSLKPDFSILINPIISMYPDITHMGSRTNLLSESPTSARIEFFSNHLHVSKSTPPAFLVHSSEDEVVPVENSISFYKSLRKAEVPVEMHLYAQGEHGFLTKPSFEEWFGRCVNWMKSMSLL